MFSVPSDAFLNVFSCGNKKPLTAFKIAVKVVQTHQTIITMNKPNKFTKQDADAIWEYLEEDQIELIETDAFICTLPKRKELQAIAVLIMEALKEAQLVHLIPALYFDAKNPTQPHHGVFRIAHYDLLTEHFKECGQCQTLTQHLTELVEWMIG